MKSVMKDYTIWYDGTLEVSPDSVSNFLSYLPNVSVTYMTDEVQQFNTFSKHRIQVKDGLSPFDVSWNMPTEYKELDVLKYVVDKFQDECTECGHDQEFRRKGLNRILSEYRLFEKHSYINMLRALIYIINTLNEKQEVWGTGRGSSVSSYILYLVGVHDVDSLKYDLDITDFFKYGDINE